MDGRAMSGAVWQARLGASGLGTGGKAGKAGSGRCGRLVEAGAVWCVWDGLVGRGRIRFGRRGMVGFDPGGVMRLGHGRLGWVRYVETWKAGRGKAGLAVRGEAG